MSGVSQLLRSERMLRTASIQNRGRRALHSRAIRLTRHVVLIALSLVMAFPFLWMILTSLKGAEEVFAQPLSFLPRTLEWGNYLEAWNAAPFGTFFLNSLIMSLGIVLAQLVTCSLAAYAFALIDFRGSRLLFLIVLATMMVPFEATMIPSYLVVNGLGLLNSFLGLILPSATSVFGIFLLRQFFLTIPKDILEAAAIDGCSHFGTFMRIVLPLSKPVLATLALFSFLGAWNNYLWPLLITTETSMRTVQVGLKYLVDEEIGTQWPQLMAASTFVIVPVLVLFLVLQRFFIKGVMHTGDR
jgi:multiple sugar transport system permease protein